MEKYLNHLNWENIMKYFYSKDESKLEDVAKLLFSENIGLIEFSLAITEALSLSYKQKALLNVKLLIVGDHIYNIVTSLCDDIQNQIYKYSDDYYKKKEEFYNVK